MKTTLRNDGRSATMSFIRLCLPLSLLLTSACSDKGGVAGNAAFTPEDPNFIVVAANELPPRTDQSIDQSPQRLDALIDEAISKGDDQRDPRYYGYAEGMVRQRLQHHAEDVALLLTLADLLQKQHAFDEARRIYEQVIELAPANPQAYLSSAMLARQRGDFKQMERFCKQLVTRTTAEIAAICLFTAQGLQGRLESSYQRLSVLFDRPLLPVILGWALQEAAEMAQRLGRYEQAEAHWGAALEVSKGSVPPAELLAAIADYYRHRQQPSEIITLLTNETEMPALAMRLAAAEIALATASNNNPDALRASWIERLQPWLELWTVRGEQSHGGELAFYLFAVKGDAAAALAPAFEQWSERKEPQDTLLLLEIIASLEVESEESRQSLRAVQAWQRQSAYEDQRLLSLLESGS
ncbi:tetratricopeptide repeat protein [Allohahella sp. A8]|uniref:tetratricopeptide repeat protein n=1 Tax=Allohahella sp. A8 TaxID=3141461 RepID=UPI003A80D84D